jgi:hypothetical protein
MWQRYDVTFDVQGRRVIVRYGPMVDTGANPIAGTEPAKPVEAQAALACDIKLDYLARTHIDIFDGPLFTMRPAPSGAVVPEFIPWHREWTHSLVIGLLFSLPFAVLFDYLAGLVCFAAYAAHTAADQLGYMGSNLVYPFRKRRTHGFKLMHAGQSFPNFAAVWCSCLLIFWNLYRGATAQLPPLNLLKLAVFGALLPAGIVVLVRRWWARRRRSA